MRKLTNLFRILTLILSGSFFSTTGFSSNLFWIGGTGNWSDVTHWATTSGGASCSCVPTVTDNVFFNANSFSGSAQSVTVDVTANCNSMDWSAITQASVFNGASDLHINGSLILKSTMDITNYSGAIYFESVNTGNTITSAGKAFSSSVYFNGNGGDWTLQDAFTTTFDMQLNYGTFITNNKNLTVSSFTSNNSNIRGLTLGSSTVTLAVANSTAWNTGGGSTFTFLAGTSLIKSTGLYTISITGGTTDIFYDVLFQNANSGAYLTGGLAFHNVTFPAVPSIISAYNGTSFHKVIFNGDGALNASAVYDSLLFAAGHTYVLEGGSTQTINNYLQVNGTCTQPILLTSGTVGTQATISQAIGSVTVNYVQMQDINATTTGSATFTANFTSDILDNTGWTMPASVPDLYWIGGNGNWNAPNHWSATSGGSAACVIPTPSTNAHFDANSFTGTAQTVTINVTAYCKSLDWSAITQTSIQMSGASDLHINGSLTMKSTMNIANYTGGIYFESVNTGNTITSAGKVFGSSIYFNGNGGDWTLQNAFTTTSDMTINYGTLITNNKNLTVNTFTSNNTNARGLTLGSSTVTLAGANSTVWNTGGSGFTFDAGTSLIKSTGLYSIGITGGTTTDVFYDVLFQNASYGAYLTGGLAFHNVTFPAVPATINANNGTSFHKVIFNGDGALNASAVYDSLLFAAGHTYVLEGGSTQTVNNYLQANGSCTQPVLLNSGTVGTQATISQAIGSVTVNYVQMQDINATGGATFVANNTTDIGNNTGWAINSSTAVIAAYTSSQNGLTTTFTNISTGATSYKWIFGDGSSSALTNPVHTYSLGGNYNVSLIASNSCGVSDTVRKTINAGCNPPTANYASNVNGLNVSFTNSSTNAANVRWNFGDATSSNSFNPAHAYFNSGTYTVCIYITNGCGKDSICKNVTVTCAAPVASYFYAVNGMTVNFTNVSSNAAISYWTFGDGQLSGQNSPSHTYNSAGTYNVKLKITNGCGKDSLTQTVTVVCSAPIPNFITNPQGLSVDFVSTSTDATSVSWDFGDSKTSILPALNHTYLTTGTYTVCITANNGCGNNSYCLPVSVCASPLANFTETSSALTATFANTSTNGINYYWNLGDANASNSVSPKHIYASPDSFKVSLVASNSCGSDTISKTIHISCTTFGAPQICMVTVDSLSKNNIIYWDKTPYKVGAGRSAVDSFIVYREVSTNLYKPIKTLAYSDSSLVRDTARTKYGILANGDPNKATYRYKIQFMDTCGGLSLLSPYHNTIYIIYAGSGQFTWNPGYTIENAITPVNNYDLYRDSASTGHWKFVASCSGTQSTVTDPNFASFPKGSWEVRTSWGITCTPTARLMQSTAVNSSRSNIRNNLGTFTGIKESDVTGSVLIYPNPAKNNLILEWQETIAADQPQIAVLNCLGMELMRFTPEKNQLKTSLNISNLAAGLYFVEIRGNKYRAVKKVIVQ